MCTGNVGHGRFAFEKFHLRYFLAIFNWNGNTVSKLFVLNALVHEHYYNRTPVSHKLHIIKPLSLVSIMYSGAVSQVRIWNDSSIVPLSSISSFICYSRKPLKAFFSSANTLPHVISHFVLSLGIAKGNTSCNNLSLPSHEKETRWKCSLFATLLHSYTRTPKSKTCTFLLEKLVEWKNSQLRILTFLYGPNPPRVL